RRQPRLLGAQPAAAEVVGLVLEVRAQLAVEIVVAHRCLLFSTGGGAPPPPRPVADASPRIRSPRLGMAPGASPHLSSPPSRLPPRGGRFCPPAPLRPAGPHFFPPRRREPVVLALAVVLAVGVPLRRQPPLALQPVERRVERAVLQPQHLVARALNVPGDFVA